MERSLLFVSGGVDLGGWQPVQEECTDPPQMVRIRFDESEDASDPGLVFEVIVPRSDEPRDLRRSGYQVAPEALLTAAHVVADGGSVRV